MDAAQAIGLGRVQLRYPRNAAEQVGTQAGRPRRLHSLRRMTMQLSLQPVELVTGDVDAFVDDHAADVAGGGVP
jgi:hypothetical protein